MREGKSLSGHERNAMFLNTSDPRRRFSDVSAISGIDVDGDGRGICLTDWDGDGDLDVWISNRTAPTVQVFENLLGSRSGDFIALQLEGTKSNRDAAGARVTVLLEDQENAPLMRTVRLGEGFQSQSAKRLHFGLGKNARISSVTVRWPGPDTEVERFEGVSPNRFFLLKQGAGRAEVLTPQSGKFVTPPASAGSEGEAGKDPGIVTSVLLPIRPLFTKILYRDLATGEEKVGAEAGKPTLLIMWHPECLSCFAELEALAGEADRLKALGIDCLATTADPSEGEDPKRPAMVIAETKFPFPVGFTPEPVIERLLALNRHLFYRPYHLAVPSAFLIDGKGRLVSVYRGEIDLDTVAEHLETLAWSEEQLAEKAAPFQGTRVSKSMGLRPAILIKVYIEHRMPDEAERILRFHAAHQTIVRQLNEVTQTIGQSYLVLGNYPSAKRLLSEAIEINPKDPQSHNNLAAVYMKEGDSAKAKRLWQKARELDVTFAAPRLNLGKLLMKEKQTTKAMGALLEFLALEPDSADGHNYLSIGYLRTGDMFAAQTHLKRLIELRPSDGNAYTNLAKVYLTLRDLKAARSVIEQGIAAEGVDPRSRQSLHRLMEQL
ncbi:MAG TPA: ASPIC/UnbV domain-containing protein [Roseibacillus sp.]|jgi:Flp pilus assembly protein TadD/peroxiredoxin|nr:ASPIC/UnbV domain-containing protein [Roseibacillus sp.]